MTAVSIEPLEKRVLLGALEHQLARQALGEPLREARFANADRAFDYDVAELAEVDVFLLTFHKADAFGSD
jgi:hypothetical protein